MATPLDLLDNAALQAPILAVCHNADDYELIAKAQALQATVWYRTANRMHAPLAWPVATGICSVLLPLPANRSTLSLCLAAACSVMDKKGALYVYGLTAAGIKSAGKDLASYFAEVELVALGGHGRLYRAQQPKQQDCSLISLQQRQFIECDGKAFDLISYPGLFAKGGLDAATLLLLQNLPETPACSVLDFACGTGVISKSLQAWLPEATFTLVDYDALALQAAQDNLPQATVKCTASPADVVGTYDLIVSNPPIHKGQQLDYSVVESLIAALPRLLAPTGTAYLVTQVTVPVARFAAQQKLTATEVAANRSFRVTRLSR